VEAVMKKGYKLLVDDNQEFEEIDDLSEIKMDRVWLNTGEAIIQLPDELLPYLEASEILGIA
jgi:hypothetical protein